MAKRRQQKKNLTKKQRELLKSQGFKEKDIKKLSSKQLENETKSIIQYISFWESESTVKEQEKRLTKAIKRDKRKKLHSKKVYMLEELGYNIQNLNVSLVRKIKLKDIETNNITMENYPDVFDVMQLTTKQQRFNYNKVYKIPNGKAFYFAYCDYTAENDLDLLIQANSRKTPKELMQGIIRLLNTPPAENGSNGKAGGYKYQFGTPSDISIFHSEKNKENKRAFERKSRVHTDRMYNGYQTLTDKDHFQNYFTEVTGKGVLTIAYTIMDNVTEFERFVFYERFYTNLVNSIPEFKEILPLPKRY